MGASVDLVRAGATNSSPRLAVALSVAKARSASSLAELWSFSPFTTTFFHFPSTGTFFGGDVAEAYAYFLACVGAEVDGGILSIEVPARLAGSVTSPTLVHSVGISSDVTSAITTEM